jgi:hypothetical protein
VSHQDHGSKVIAESALLEAISRTFRSAILSLLAIPVVFLGVLFTWGRIDEWIGSREVSQYIRDHQSIVSQRLKDPKVHTFSLTHDRSQPGTLLIQFDVDDKATYEMLESDLDHIWGMRFPPKWETTIRTQETLSDNLGYAAWGMAEALEALTRIALAGIVSLAPVTFFTILGLYRTYRAWRARLRIRTMMRVIAVVTLYMACVGLVLRLPNAYLRTISGAFIAIATIYFVLFRLSEWGRQAWLSGQANGDKLPNSRPAQSGEPKRV